MITNNPLNKPYAATREAADAKAEKDAGHQVGGDRSSVISSPTRHGKAAAASTSGDGNVGPLALTPADTAAVDRFRRLFGLSLQHPIEAGVAADLASGHAILTMVVDPARPFITAIETRQGDTFSVRHGPAFPPYLLGSGANIVILPRPAPIGSLFTSQNLSIALNLILILVMLAIFFSMARMMKMKNARIKPEAVGDVSFSSIAGQAQAKLELQEVVESLKHPERLKRFGIQKAVNNVLLIGPPGNGKTLLAKAIANEANVDFFAVAGSDFVEMFVGVGASRVRSLFRSAQKGPLWRRLLQKLFRVPVRPAVLFIDEIDAVGGKRGRSMAGNDERETTLNQILVEMDGIVEGANKHQAPFVVVAATNRADTLDEALLRRFQKKIDVLQPDSKARTEILMLNTRKMPAGDVDFVELAAACRGFSGADLAALAQEAAVIAVRHGDKSLSMRAFSEARRRVLLGVPRAEMKVSNDQMRIIAVHEAGHAIACLVLPHADTPIEATLIPHGAALGHVSHIPPDDEVVVSRARIMDQLRVMMAGRAAEEIVFSREMATTGAAQDRKQAIALIVTMITEYGLGESANYVGAVRTDSIFSDGRQALPQISESARSELDAEVKRIFSDICDTTHAVLTSYKSALLHLARELIRRGSLSRAEMEKILRENPMGKSVADQWEIIGVPGHFKPVEHKDASSHQISHRITKGVAASITGGLTP